MFGVQLDSADSPNKYLLRFSVRRYLCAVKDIHLAIDRFETDINRRTPVWNKTQQDTIS